jgi:hypothetical protein
MNSNRRESFTIEPTDNNASNVAILRRSEQGDNPERVEAIDSSWRLLRLDFNPRPFDVICARGKYARDHTGTYY